ncbi:archaea-specific SMC-related protein [Natrialbaceae archaeon AArc-T1-2]|uniref:archaea-specific SMC-related protein n=1 Tax=Natrialbaceae archaeon AArc-T1-2 TaxID=3053904 RepID=UPI00255A9AEA|nr:archaea-specific SMC-related protein [Natrialbaceae archaeon AArc-T1-2]WIV67850.1 chromosome segregation protein SMC [Natrialbaceae archaeon AArc-T1-2]
MSKQRTTGVELRVQNIGGIDSTSVTFDSGITVLSGRNATNRTSLLKATMAALGSDETALKSDADRGEVELALDGETYTRTLARQGTTIRTDGDPYLEDPELADLFAFLLESNEARQAVARGDDLREIIMRPVDTDEIQARITQIQAERRDLEDELDAIDEQADRLPRLEEQRTELQSEIESTRSQLEELEAEIEESDVDETATEQDDELEATLAELRSTRESLEDVRYELETERESLSSLEDELEGLEVDDVDPDEIEEELEWLRSQLDRLRSRKGDLDARLDDLQSIIRFNEETLEDRDPDVSLSDESGSVTEQLAADRTVTCWTCGTDVERDQIESTIGQLRELRQDLLGDRKEIQAEINEHSDRRRELQSTLDERERTINRRESLQSERETRQDRIDDLEEQATELEATIDELEAEVDTLDTDDRSEVVDKHKQANELEFQLGRSQQRLESVEEKIETIEKRLEDRESMTDRVDEINDELESLRTRVEDIEREAVEQFNYHMDELVDVLGYSNIERIWIERLKQEGRRGTPESSFELHVVRATDDGTTYEDVVDNLSESEREITGLVFALAGYLVHDVYETVPFMLLDSLEAIDAERIATLLEYLADYAEYLVVALLTEDAQAVDERHQRIETI